MSTPPPPLGEAAPSPRGTTSITLSSLPPKVRSHLDALDLDRNGVIDVGEIATAF